MVDARSSAPKTHQAGGKPQRRRTAIDVLATLIPKRRNLKRELIYAVLLTLVALATRLLIAPLESGIQYVTFFPAVALAAVLGGLWPGLLAAAISVVLVTYLFWPPYGTLSFAYSHIMVLSNFVFVLDALLVSASIEAMHNVQRRLRDKEQQLRQAATVFENSLEGVMVTDVGGVIQTVNPAFTDITGYTAQEAKGQKPNLLRSDRQHPTFYRAMWDKLVSEGRWEGELWNRRKSGEPYLAFLTISLVRDDEGRAAQYVSVFRDVTALRERDEHTRHMAFHDALTGLPNRALLEDRLQHALARTSRGNGRLALFFIDLDGFKPVNDTLGHDAGDLLLQEVAQRLKGRARDMDTVARFGGDEFVILAEDATREDCAKFARDLLDAVSMPFMLDGRCVTIGASIGVAVFPDDAGSYADLLKAADAAMYQAKTAGRGTYRLAGVD